MSTLSDSSQNWFSRPADQRFVSIDDMIDQATDTKTNSKSFRSNINMLEFVPDNEVEKGLYIRNKESGALAVMTSSSFDQLATLADTPKGFIGKLSSKTASMVLNERISDLGDAGVESQLYLGKKNGVPTIHAATSATYQRIYNADVLKAIRARFGNGVDKSNDFIVPGEFGKPIEVTKDNTTLFLGPQDMHVFLCDEKHRIEVPNRRNGEKGTLARGFFISNSETGHGLLKVTTFLFDYACKNRTVWGVEEVNEVKIKHTVNAPDAWLERMAPMLSNMANEKASVTEKVLIAAQNMRLGTNEEVLEFTAKKFGTMKLAKLIGKAHEADEGREIRNLWDLTVGATAFARGIPYQNERVTIEATAGKLLDLVKEAA